MCISWKKQIAAALLLLCLPLLLVACGGGGGGGGATRTITGVATKGPIAGGIVSVYRMQQNGTRGALIGSGVTGSDGGYTVAVPASEAGPFVISVAGKPGASYTSETTGLPVAFSANETFSAAVESVAPGVNVAVSPLTEAAFQKLPLILAEKPGALTLEKLTSSISAANAQVGALFNVSNILAPPANDPVYQAALMVIDRMVEDSKAGGTITDTTAAMTVLSQAVAEIDPAAPAYQTFVSVFTAAAAQVATDNPAVSGAVGAITNQVTNPPAEPDYSDVTAPATVTGLSALTAAVSSTSSSVTLSWNPSSDANGVKGYDIYRDGNKVGTSTGTTFTDPSVTSNVTYAYTVVAFDAAGNRSAASAPLSVKPNQASLNVTVSGQLSNDLVSQLDLAAPSAATGLSAVTSAVSGTNSSVALSWTAATDNVGVAGYDVYRDGVKIGTATGTTYTDASVTSNVTYSYTVKAFDAAGNRSVSSAALSVKPNQASLGVTVGGQVNP